MERFNLHPAAGFAIVFGGQPDDRKRFAESFAAAHPEVCCDVLPVLRDYKKPFLGKHKPLWKVLCQDLKKNDRENTLTLLDLHAKVLGQPLLDRAPTAMSRGQQLFWSQVFRAIRGERFFLLRDDNAPFSRETVAQLVCWLRRNFENVRVVWVTSATPEQLTQPCWSEDASKLRCLDSLREDLQRMTPLTVADSIWQLQGDTVTQVDLASLVKPNQPESVTLPDSAEGCFTAAEGCLSGDGHPEDALPYLEKLLTLMDEGDPDAGRYIMTLNRLDPVICGQAWQAHQAKK